MSRFNLILVSKKNYTAYKEIIPSHRKKKYLNLGKYLILSFLGIYRNYLFSLCEVSSKRCLGAFVLRYKSKLIWRVYGEWWIYHVYIKKEFRGSGLGNTLMIFCIEELKKRNIKEVYLKVSKDNNVAISLYTKLKFEMVNSNDENYIMKRKI